MSGGFSDALLQRHALLFSLTHISASCRVATVLTSLFFIFSSPPHQKEMRKTLWWMAVSSGIWYWHEVSASHRAGKWKIVEEEEEGECRWIINASLSPQYGLCVTLMACFIWHYAPRNICNSPLSFLILCLFPSLLGSRCQKLAFPRRQFLRY